MIKRILSNGFLKLVTMVVVIFISRSLQASPISKINVALFHTFSKASSVCYDPYGQNLERGIRLAWEDFKKEHKKLSYDILFTKYDYDNDKIKAIEVVDEATKGGALVGMGFMCSDFAILGGKRAQENKLPIVTPTATDDEIATIGDYVTTGIYTNSVQGNILANFSYNDLAKRRTIIISAADCSYCTSLASAYRKSFEALGGKIVGEYNILTSDTDFSSLLSNIEIQNFDSILLPNYAMQSALIISYLLKYDIVSTFLGGDGWTWSEQIYDIINDKRLDAYFTTSWIHEVQNEKSRKFFQRFGAQFKEEALGTVAHCYDVAMILYDVLDGLKTYNRGTIKEALNQAWRYNGITGTFLHQRGKRYSDRTVILVKVSDRKQIVIKTLNP